MKCCLLYIRVWRESARVMQVYCQRRISTTVRTRGQRVEGDRHTNTSSHFTMYSAHSIPFTNQTQRILKIILFCLIKWARYENTQAWHTHFFHLFLQLLHEDPLSYRQNPQCTKHPQMQLTLQGKSSCKGERVGKVRNMIMQQRKQT